MLGRNKCCNAYKDMVWNSTRANLSLEFRKSYFSGNLLSAQGVQEKIPAIQNMPRENRCVMDYGNGGQVHPQFDCENIIHPWTIEWWIGMDRQTWAEVAKAEENADHFTRADVLWPHPKRIIVPLKMAIVHYYFTEGEKWKPTCFFFF